MDFPIFPSFGLGVQAWRASNMEVRTVSAARLPVFASVDVGGQLRERDVLISPTIHWFDLHPPWDSSV